jgi:hypothetical protein
MLGFGFLWLFPGLSSPGEHGRGSPEEVDRGRKTTTPEIALYEAVTLDSVPDYHRQRVIQPNTKEFPFAGNTMSGHLPVVAYTD